MPEKSSELNIQHYTHKRKNIRISSKFQDGKFVSPLSSTTTNEALNSEIQNFLHVKSVQNKTTLF